MLTVGAGQTCRPPRVRSAPVRRSVRTGRLLTDTQTVAIAFGKRHADVLRTVEKMLVSERTPIAEHARRNFALGSYADAQGQQRPMYRMSSKGLSELAMDSIFSPSPTRAGPGFKPVRARTKLADILIIANQNDG